MLNTADIPVIPQIIDYANVGVAHEMANGQMNTTEDRILANIAYAIRQGHPQIRTDKTRPDRICLVGSGPSLNDTLEELRQLVWEGATLVTLNGAYQWCIEHNLRPQTQIVMDARPSNARFVQPEVPRCNYIVASQCAPEVWDAVAGRPHVWIWHPVVKSAEEKPTKLLDDFYFGNWIGVGGGTTVATRAMNMLRICGYLRFDLFGIDCCWKDNQHHALPQPENDGDRRTKQRLTVSVRGSDDVREFSVSAWHCKQLQDFLETLHTNGHLYQLTVHGDGLLAHVINQLGTVPDAHDLTLERTDDDGGTGIQAL